MYTGAMLNFVENPDTVPENVREIAPDRLHRRAARLGEVLFGRDDRARRKRARCSRRPTRWAHRRRRTQSPSACWPASRCRRRCGCSFRLARWLALDNVRKLIGIHRARFLRHRRGADLAGAGPLVPGAGRADARGVGHDRDLRRRHRHAGRGASSRARSARPPPYNEVRVDPRTGELLVRGPNVFMGYLNQPEKTAETIDADGWLHTGDVGSVDADGYFRITDRMKDIIITAGGKNITPSEFENELKFSPYITDAVVIGDKRAYLTVLVMIDQENVEKYAQDHDVPFSNYASLTRAQRGAGPDPGRDRHASTRSSRASSRSRSSACSTPS